ncbi:hypothetical protein ALC152_07460 [Arcobacter sp. 15-2]|uniref:FkbM family methyltransferase n=1 Tax=Arcobacter sp. 15-2 TaxID=3374109 RepID=UPI00399CA2FF
MKKQNTILIEVDNVTYSIYLPGREIDYIQKKIYEEKVPYEYEMLKDIISRVKKDIIIDVGANIGNHSLFLAANGYDVYSFEANSEVFDIFDNSIKINGFDDKIKAYNFGISDTISKAKITNIDKKNLGGQSLLIGEGNIELKPLSDIRFPKKISVIKIDVEGMEINVLKGAKELIKKDRPLLYIEAININEYKKLNFILDELSYVYWETFNATPTHLFIPKESLSEKDIMANTSYKNISETYRMTQQLNYSKRITNDLSEVLKVLSKNLTLLEEEKNEWTKKELKHNSDLISAQNENKKLEIEKEKITKTLNEKEEENKKLEIEKDEIRKKFEKMETNFIGMKERNNRLEDEKKELVRKLTESQNQFKRYYTQVQKLKLVNKQVKKGFEDNKKSASYQLGHLLIHEIKNPKVFLTAPKRIYEIWKNKSTKKETLKSLSKTNKKLIHKEKIPFDKSNSELKMASIMDEFTYNSFKYECNLLQITPNDWKNELKSFKPDLVFIESAWKGKDDLWATKVSNCAVELVEMIQWCDENNIQTMFWNKEDPVHFDTFIPVAKMVDYVFTTDIDCVPMYKEKVGHNNVQFLPFAAQPAVHNPIELFERKDAFNFAGSYYLRYPQRQKDFSSLIGAVKKFRPVDIYDRNFDNPHPHYTFPDEYKPMILGKLPFEEIDKAYKGYLFGINMNTIKQSQSMFARRVFELLASNTVVVSNFSRGVRLLFGDLVISSDNEKELSDRLEVFCKDELSYKKLRLMGLRKVMLEHTYAQRLNFITSKVFDTSFENEEQQILLISIANSKAEALNIIDSFTKQNYQHKELYILINFQEKLVCENNIKIFKNEKDFVKIILSNNDATFFGKLESNDYYGENYLTDMNLSTRYSDADAFGKSAYYEFDTKIKLKNNNTQYKKVEKLQIQSSLVKKDKLDKKLLKNIIKNNNEISFENMLAIDEFNYCSNGYRAKKNDLEKYIDDLNLIDQGISFEQKLSKIADTLPAKAAKEKDETSLPKVTAEKLFNLFPTPASSKVKISLDNNKMKIDTKLGNGKHTYIYADKQFKREELNLVLNSQFTLVSKSTLQDVKTVFEFQDKDGQKISHSMNPSGETHSLAIPSECVYIRFGLKLVGDGTLNISNLILGTHGEVPFAVIGKSKKLVLTKQYPSYDDIYKYGFLHSRIRAYKQKNMMVDVFRINNQAQKPYREFEDIDVVTGDNELLEQTLQTGQYDHVLVHLIDENMWKVLEKFIDKVKVTVWVHGAEIQVWQRRSYEFERMTQDEIQRQKRLSAHRVKFWHKILTNPPKNFQLVFVSKTFTQEIEEDLKMKLPIGHTNIIHNYVDSNIFKYFEKKVEDRTKILSIRSFASRKYANDLSVKAIVELSKKDFFNQLEFLIIGDGDLFDKKTEALKKFTNVKLEKRFAQHAEIAKLQEKYGVFLNPTRWDSQGVSRDEAMSSGLVVVTTNNSAIPEFIDNNSGRVVEPENPKALADAIEYLYKNPERYLELSAGASQRVRQQCGFEQTIEKEIEIIK